MENIERTRKTGEFSVPFRVITRHENAKVDPTSKHATKSIAGTVFVDKPEDMTFRYEDTLRASDVDIDDVANRAYPQDVESLSPKIIDKLVDQAVVECEMAEKKNHREIVERARRLTRMGAINGGISGLMAGGTVYAFVENGANAAFIPGLAAFMSGAFATATCFITERNIIDYSAQTNVTQKHKELYLLKLFRQSILSGKVADTTEVKQR